MPILSVPMRIVFFFFLSLANPVTAVFMLTSHFPRLRHWQQLRRAHRRRTNGDPQRTTKSFSRSTSYGVWLFSQNLTKLGHAYSRLRVFIVQPRRPQT